MRIGRLRPLVAAALVAATAAPAAVAAPAPGASAEAWYWRPQTPAAVPVRVPAVDADGLLPVAVTAGQPQKVALLAVDPGDPSATAVRLTLALETGTGAEVNAAGAAIRACLVTADWVPVDAGPWDALPPYDCDAGADVEIRREAGEAVAEADLSALASAWAAGVVNHGIALVPDPAGAADATWQVSFRGITLGGVEVRSEGAPPRLLPAEPSQSAPVRVDAPAPVVAAPPTPVTARRPVPVVAAVPARIPPPPRPKAVAPVAEPVAAPLTTRVTPAVVVGALPFERGLEGSAVAAGMLLSGVAGALVALAAGRRSRRQLYLGAGVSVWCMAAGAILLSWNGAAGQPVVWAQVPYLASGALTAVLLVIMGCTLVVASAAMALPPTHPLVGVARLLRPGTRTGLG